METLPEKYNGKGIKKKVSGKALKGLVNAERRRRDEMRRKEWVGEQVSAHGQGHFESWFRLRKSWLNV